MMRIVPLVAIGTLLVACQRNPPYTTFCDSELNGCREFRTEEQFIRWQEFDLARRKNLAKHLPVDYREIAFVLLQSYLGHESPTDPPKPRFFLSVFEEDPDPALRARLANAGIIVEPKSAYDSALAQKQVSEPTILTGLWKIGIDEIRWVGSDNYYAKFGYSCGSLCAGGMEAFLRCRETKCEIVKIEDLWIS